VERQGGAIAEQTSFPDSSAGEAQFTCRRRTEIITSKASGAKGGAGPQARGEARLSHGFEKAAAGGTIEDWIAEELLKRLKVETSQSSVIHVTFSSRDARTSAQVADAFAKPTSTPCWRLRVSRRGRPRYGTTSS